MALWKPDQTFYPSPRMAMEGAARDGSLMSRRSASIPNNGKHDAIYVLDLDPDSPSTYAQSRRPRSRCPTSATSCITSDGTRAARRCAPTRRIRTSSAATCWFPACAPRASTSSTPSPTRAIRSIVKVIEPEEIASRTGYSRPHTIHCGPDAIYVSALGAPNGDGPGGIFLLDHESFDVLGRWEVDRGPQYLAYDFWWHLGYDVAITSEWGTPNMIENGLSLDLLLGGNYGHAASHLGPAQAPPSAGTRPRRRASDGARAAARARSDQGLRLRGVVISTKDLSASIWLWHRETATATGRFRKVIEIPAEPADPDHAAARAQAVQGRAAAGHRYQPQPRRQVPLRFMLGHRRPAASTT